MSTKTKSYLFIKSVAILTGTTIGVGVLALPYSIYQAGYWLGTFYLLSLGLILIQLNLMLGEVVLRTKKELAIPEIIHLYLGKKGYLLALFSLFIIIYGAMTAYIQAAGEIMQRLIPVSSFHWSALFFVTGTYFISKGLKFVSKWEIVFVTAMLLILFLLWFQAIYSQSLDWSQFRLQTISSLTNSVQPYGIILFSYFGVIAIPHIKSILGKQNLDQLQAVIKLSNLIIILIYSLFVSLVIGVVGGDIEPLTLISLGNKLGAQVLMITSLFALLAIITTFITMGLSMVQSYQHFGKLKSDTAVLLTTFPPMTILLIGSAQFNTMIQYAGGVGVSLVAILIVLTFWRAKLTGKVVPAYSLGHLKWLGIGMIIVFSLGIMSLFI